MTITYDEAPVTDVTPDDMDAVSSDVHACIDCGKPVPPTASGRQFERCIDCRRAFRQANGGSSPTATGRKAPNWEPALQQGITDNLLGIGFAVSIFEQYDGMCIMQGAPRLAESLIGPARTNPKVRKALEKAVQSGAWAGVAMAAAAIIVPILAHHKMLPAMPNAMQAPMPPNGSNAGHIG